MYLKKCIMLIVVLLMVMTTGIFTCNAMEKVSDVNQAETNKNIKYFVAMGRITSSGDEKLQCALQLLKLGDFKDGISFLKDASNTDVKEASRLLGKLYYRGVETAQISIPKNELQGLRYFVKAEDYEIINHKIADIKKEANKGNNDYQCFLGELYFYGHTGDNISYQMRMKEAEKLFLQAANAGNSDAALDLAYLYKRVELYNDSYIWIEKAANMGNSLAMFVMYSLSDPRVDTSCNMIGALPLYHYNMAKKNDSVARAWLEKGLNKDYLWAKREMAIRYIDGNGVKQDIDTGCRLLSEAANNGDKKSLEAIKALKMISTLKELANSGDTDAQITYSILIH